MIYTICREICYDVIYALLRGEKLNQRLRMWRKNDKYEVWSNAPGLLPSSSDLYFRGPLQCSCLALCKAVKCVPLMVVIIVSTLIGRQCLPIYIVCYTIAAATTSSKLTQVTGPMGYKQPCRRKTFCKIYFHSNFINFTFDKIVTIILIS